MTTENTAGEAIVAVLRAGVLRPGLDGGEPETEVVATDVDDLFSGYVFGPRAAAFGGEEWARELRNSGLA